MHLKSMIGASLAALLLVGCGFGGLTGSAPATYDLEAPAVEKISGRRNVQLTVNMPVAIKTIDTEEILVKSQDGRVSYFSGAAWGDRLPKLFQARLVETFANTGAYRAVLTSQDRVTGDLSLSIEIRDFEIATAANSSEAVIDVYVKLVNERSNTVVNTGRFQERTKATGTDVAAGVRAINATFQKTALAIVAWTSSRRG